MTTVGEYIREALKGNMKKHWRLLDNLGKKYDDRLTKIVILIMERIDLRVVFENKLIQNKLLLKGRREREKSYDLAG